jgi:predicted CXXCH cytochrome family protein
MERRGVLRRMKPVSNAFVLYGHCLACHSVHSTEEGDLHAEDES